MAHGYKASVKTEKLDEKHKSAKLLCNINFHVWLGMLDNHLTDVEDI